MTNTLRIVVAFAICFALVGVSNAQQVQVTTPLVNVTDSFYENIGLNWGYQSNNPNGFSFNFGSPNSTAPAFGGFDPSSQARFGFGTSTGGGRLSFNLSAGQGSNRTVTSSAPTLTLQNGVPGSIQDVSVRPFVVGFTPIVGGRPMGPVTTRPVLTSPIAERMSRLRQQAAAANPRARQSDRELLLGASQRDADSQPTRTTSAPRATDSSAAHGDISLAEIRRQQQAQPRKSDNGELQALIDTARVAEAGGYLGAARIRYRKAAAQATGQLKADLLAKLESLAK